MSLKIDTQYEFDSRTIIGENLPTVYMDRVILEKVSLSALPSTPSLQATLSIIIKDAASGKFSLWFSNPYSSILKKKIKIAVAQVTNEAAIAAWSKVTTLTDLPFLTSGDNKQSQVLLNGTSIQYYTLEDLLGSGDSSSMTTRFIETGNKIGAVYSFNKSIIFPSNQKTPGNTPETFLPEDQKQLSYFAFTFIDSDRDTDTPQPISKMTQEDVISNGKTVKESSVFLTTEEEQRIWTGPVHYHDGDVRIDDQPYYGYMGGLNHAATINQPTLTRIKVENNTIHDFRSLDKLNTQVASQVPISADPYLKDEIDKNSVFSNLDISRGPEGNCDFVFSMSLRSLLKSKSLDGQNLTNQNIDNILKFIDFESIKVFRKRMSGSPLLGEKKFDPPSSKKFSPPIERASFNKFRMDRIGDIEQSYVMTGGNYDKKFQKRYAVDRTRELIVEAYEENGLFKTSPSTGDGVSSIQKIDQLFSEDENHEAIITFTGTDNSVKKFSNGFYQYELEVVINDQKYQYFSDARNTLTKHIETLSKITSVHAISPEFYDSLIDKFTVKFIDQLSLGKEGVDISYDFWEEIPRDFLEIYDAITTQPIDGQTKQNISLTMKNVLSPISGTSEGYTKIQKILESLIALIDKSLLLAPVKSRDKNTKVEVFKSRASTNNYNPWRTKISTNIIFKEIFNASLESDFGTMFFDIEEQDLENSTPGVRTISFENFKGYKDKEVEKIYSSKNADISISQFPNAGSFTETTAYSFFTPSLIFNKYNKPEKINKFVANEDKSIDSLINKLSLDQGKNTNSALQPRFNGDTTLQSETADFNSKLSNYFSLNYDASVVVGENNNENYKSPGGRSFENSDTNDFGGVLKRDIASKDDQELKQKSAAPILKTLLSENIIGKQSRVQASNFSPNVLVNEEGIDDAKIASLPNQVKALIVSQDTQKNIQFSPQPGVKPEVINFIRQDPFKDPQTFMKAKYMFETIAKVEYLSGHEKTSKTGDPSLKSQVWKTLDKNTFKSAEEQNKKVLCRLVPYSDGSLNISYDEEQSLPMLDNVFFIGSEELDTVKNTSSQSKLSTKGLSMKFNNTQYQTTYVPNGEVPRNQRQSPTTRVPRSNTNLQATPGGSSY